MHFGGFGVLAIFLLCACHPQDIDPLEQQPKYKAYSENKFFADRRAMRTPPEGTIPLERNLEHESPPAQLDAALLELGREAYERTCLTCHGVLGDGEGVVSGKMGLKAPPSLHTDRLRAMPAADMYRIISDGYGLMPRYSTVLTARERWAAIAYVRALQLSQHLPLAEAPADVRKQMEGQ
jgi:mono/diheme cytochrome c family protein